MTRSPDKNEKGANASDPLEAYSRMISGLVHDLRTPITSIIGAASSLQSYADKFDEVVKARLLRSIVEEAEHLDRMLSNLSVLAKARSGLLEPQRRELLLPELLNAAIEKAVARHEDATIRMGEGCAGKKINVDPKLVQDALLNLTDLAAGFGGAAFALDIDATQTSKGLQLTLSAPTSPSLATKLVKLVESFRQGKRTSEVKASDCILLEAAQELVQIHGGSLSIDHDLTKNQFRILLTLPI